MTVGGVVSSAVLPALSQLALPPVSEKAIPLSVLPSSPTALASTSNRTHCPAGGDGPICLRPAVPLPLSAPQ